MKYQIWNSDWTGVDKDRTGQDRTILLFGPTSLFQQFLGSLIRSLSVITFTELFLKVLSRTSKLEARQHQNSCTRGTTTTKRDETVKQRKKPLWVWPRLGVIICIILVGAQVTVLDVFNVRHLFPRFSCPCVELLSRHPLKREAGPHEHVYVDNLWSRFNWWHRRIKYI
jgi:hypothetical protein